MRMIRLNQDYLDRVLAGDSDLPTRRTGPCSLALGSFDGLHQGHRALVDAVRSAKTRFKLANTVLLTFRDHPRLVLGGVNGPFLLTTWREKLSVLEQLGIDVVVAVDFSPSLARVPYREFVERFMVQWLGVQHLVAGHDVHMGAERGGDAASLGALTDELGIGLEVVSPVTWNNNIVSSSAVRDALTHGDCEAATGMLGRPYAVWGEVTPGDGRGRTIGYPTANVTPLDPHKLLPSRGVYACRVQVSRDVSTGGGDGVLGFVDEPLPEVDRNGDILSPGDGRWRLYGGMLNFGHVPTFHEGGLELPRIEVNLFDFFGDLRGRTIKVEWLRRLRAERKFSGKGDLITQLRVDEQQAREVVADTPLRD